MKMMLESLWVNRYYHCLRSQNLYRVQDPLWFVRGVVITLCRVPFFLAPQRIREWTLSIFANGTRPFDSSGMSGVLFLIPVFN